MALYIVWDDFFYTGYAVNHRHKNTFEILPSLITILTSNNIVQDYFT